MKSYRIFELFAGYGGGSFGLKKAGISHDIVGFSEIDKFAIKCFKQNHGEIYNFGDIKQINPYTIPDFDILTGGFPCQSFSKAGNLKGELDPRGTLFYDIIRIAEVKQPKYILLENVKGLTSKKFKDTFAKILSELDRIGYYVYWDVLNTKDYGIPQNRERVWFVCIRKDLGQLLFKFPKKEELNMVLADILEDNADEKYYLSESNIKQLINNSERRSKPVKNRLNRDIATTLTSRNPSKSLGDANLITHPLGYSKYIDKRVYGIDGISPAINIKEKYKILQNNKIRKLTPKECFRLMGFLNDEINLDGLSDTQKYKLAGNGWDINLVAKILDNLLGGD